MNDTEHPVSDDPLEVLRSMRVEDLGEYDAVAGLAQFEAAKATVTATTAAGSKLTVAAWVGGATTVAVAATLTVLAVSKTPEPAMPAGVDPPASTPEAVVAPAIEPDPAPPSSDLEPPPAPRPHDTKETVVTPREESPKKRSQRPARPRPGSTNREPDDLKVRDETALTNKMRKALGRSPALALELAEQGEREFPNGMFRRERSAHAVLALAALGRLAEARVRAKAYLAQYPTGPLSDRVRAAIGQGN